MKQPHISSHIPAAGKIKGVGRDSSTRQASFYTTLCFWGHLEFVALSYDVTLKAEDALNRWLFRTLRCTLRVAERQPAHLTGESGSKGSNSRDKQTASVPDRSRKEYPSEHALRLSAFDGSGKIPPLI